jgi:hypothetical protein
MLLSMFSYTYEKIGLQLQVSDNETCTAQKFRAG